MATIELEKFANRDLASIYQCIICTDIAIEPKEHTGVNACEAIYCQSCIDGILNNEEPKCGLRCSAAFNESSMRDLRRSSKAVHESLILNCPYCNDVLRMEQIPAHRKECILFPKPPPKCKGTMTERVALYSNSVGHAKQPPIRNIRLNYEGQEAVIRVGNGDNLRDTFTRARTLSQLEDGQFAVILVTHKILQPGQMVRDIDVKGQTAYINVTNKSTQRWDRSVSIIYNNSLERSTPNHFVWPEAERGMEQTRLPPTAPAEHILMYDLEPEEWS